MNNPIHFTDEHFYPHNSAFCHLFIHLDTDSYSYTIVSKETNRLNVLFKKHFPESTATFSASNRLEILLGENENLNLDYAKVKISVETKAFTFIPEELYTPADLLQYRKYIGAEPQSALLNTDIRPFAIKNISAVEADLENNLKNAFKDPLILSQANPFISGVHSLQQKGNQSELFLNFNSNRFEAAVIKNGALEFYNIFDISSADEFNYFILNLLEQLNIDPSLPVTLSGEIDSENEMYLRLQKYFEQLFFAEIDVWSNVSEVSNQVAPHRFFSLLALDLCE